MPIILSTYVYLLFLFQAANIISSGFSVVSSAILLLQICLLLLVTLILLGDMKILLNTTASRILPVALIPTLTLTSIIIKQVIANNIELTISYATFLFLVIPLCLAISSYKNPSRLFHDLILATFAGSSACAILSFLSLEGYETISGVIRYNVGDVSFNTLARNSLYGFLAGMHLINSSNHLPRLLLYLLTALNALLIAVVFSKTSIFILILLILASPSIYKNNSARLFALISVSLSFLILISKIVTTLSDQIELNNILQLSGRLSIWPIIYENTTSSSSLLWFGYGFEKSLEAIPFWHGNQLMQAHNSLLQIQIDSGLIVVIGYLGAILYCIIVSSRLDQNYRYFSSGVLIILILRGITEASFGFAGSIDNIYLLLLIAFMSNQRMLSRFK